MILTHFNNFWGQKLTECDIMGENYFLKITGRVCGGGLETDPLYQFQGPENFKRSQFLFKWIFLVSIKLLHNPEKQLGTEIDKMCQFLGPKTDP
jgi:hypothetical protein